MAVVGLLALLDDISVILDDVALMTKMAAKKTAGVVGDDLALNAKQLIGLHAAREIPVIMAVAKGSLINKAILVPLALLISFFIPWLIMPLLMIGGAYLCFEGVEKILHQLLHHSTESSHDVSSANTLHLAEFEQDKIRGAIRTDFILSAEIIVIALGVLAQTTLVNQIMVLVIIALAMTIGVYGFVALIVKMDDVGLWLLAKDAQGRSFSAKVIGHALLYFAPRLLKLLSIVGTLAMFLVGGGIVVHQLPILHHIIESLLVLGGAYAIPVWLNGVYEQLLLGLAGVGVGLLCVGALHMVQFVKEKLVRV